MSLQSEFILALCKDLTEDEKMAVARQLLTPTEKATLLIEESDKITRFMDNYFICVYCHKFLPDNIYAYDCREYNRFDGARKVVENACRKCVYWCEECAEHTVEPCTLHHPAPFITP